MVNRSLFGVLVVMAAAIVSGCDTMQLLAPTNSTVTLTAPTTVLPTGGSTEVTAVVLESAGTPVQNGTTVRFTTNLGRLEPEEVQTRNGMAVVTFHAGDASGTATISARSGAAGGATAGAGGAPAATTSSVTISVGAAAVTSVGVQANPSFVSANGGSVTVVATVLGTGGRALAGVPVTFSTTAGSLSPTQAVTDASGQATSRLTTTSAATVTVSAGSPAVTGTAAVTVLAEPSLTISCAVGSTTNCLNVVAGQPVALTVSRAAGTSVIRSATLTFGDGSPSVDLGSLAAPVTIPHVYSEPGSYTARVTATDVNGESVTVTQFVQVFAPATGTVSAEVVSGRTVRATASISGGNVLSYAWTFDTGITFTTSSGEATYTYPPVTVATTKTVSVTATLADGRTITAVTTVVLVP